MKARPQLHQDGIDRFAIVGRLTPHKHVELEYYARFVKIDRFTIVTSCRHPIERLLSSYFSPSNWYIRRRDGQWWLQEPYWDSARFLKTLTLPAVDYFKLKGVFRAPDIALRFDRLEADFAEFLCASAIPAVPTLPRLNASRTSTEAFERARADPIVSEVAYTHFREDFERFGFSVL